jgi:hypothetical protein
MILIELRPPPSIINSGSKQGKLRRGDSGVGLLHSIVDYDAQCP